MQFYRNCKEGPSCLIVQKQEWRRLQRRSDTAAEPSNEQKQYVQSLIEQSNAWTRTWPDTDLGRVALYQKEQQRQRDDTVAAVKSSVKKKSAIERIQDAEAIKEAREKIFQGSCYGQKLQSAFRESKTLEERDLQIKFLNEIRNKQELEDKQSKIEPFCSFQLDKHETDEEKYRKCTAIQTARLNKEISETQKAEAAKEKAAQKHADLENSLLMTQLLDLEKEAKVKLKIFEKEALDQYLADHNKSKEERARREAENNTKIDKCHNEKEQLNCKIKRVLREIRKKAEDNKEIYEIIKKSQEEERKRADAFENKIINTRDGLFATEENKCKEKKERDREERLSIAATNKEMAEYEKQRRCTSINKCLCDRQSVIVKNHKHHSLQKRNTEIANEEKRPPYFGPSNKLTSELKKRMEEYPPWTGVKAIHEEFARHADDTLRDCKYKNAGRKVVDEYIKYNGLEALAVPNYY